MELTIGIDNDEDDRFDEIRLFFQFLYTKFTTPSVSKISLHFVAEDVSQDSGWLLR